MSTVDFNNGLLIDIYDLNYLLDNWTGSLNDTNNFNELENNWNKQLNLPSNYDIGIKIAPNGDIKIRLSNELNSINSSLYFFGASFTLSNGTGWTKTDGAQLPSTTQISANSYGIPSSINYNINGGINIEIFANPSGPPTTDYKLLSNNWETLVVNADKTSQINFNQDNDIILNISNNYSLNNSSNRIVINNNKIWHPNITLT